jgi:hypothetical protein
MSDRINTAIELSRMVGRIRWGFYFDLFCMVSIGTDIRPVLASLAPILAITEGTYAFLASDRCPFRAMIILMQEVFVTPLAAPARARCGARRSA